MLTTESVFACAQKRYYSAQGAFARKFTMASDVAKRGEKRSFLFLGLVLVSSVHTSSSFLTRPLFISIPTHASVLIFPQNSPLLILGLVCPPQLVACDQTSIYLGFLSSSLLNGFSKLQICLLASHWLLAVPTPHFSTRFLLFSTTKSPHILNSQPLLLPLYLGHFCMEVFAQIFSSYFSQTLAFHPNAPLSRELAKAVLL